jgi:hypothetical protein
MQLANAINNKCSNKVDKASKALMSLTALESNYTRNNKYM